MNTTEIARALGSLGGRTRARRLSGEQKKRIAAAGGRARAQSLQAERDIADNFAYVAMIDELQGKPPKVKRSTTFDGPLPGIYPARETNA
jgi:hypothetical protein